MLLFCCRRLVGIRAPDKLFSLGALWPLTEDFSPIPGSGTKRVTCTIWMKRVKNNVPSYTGAGWVRHLNSVDRMRFL